MLISANCYWWIMFWCCYTYDLFLPIPHILYFSHFPSHLLCFSFFFFICFLFLVQFRNGDETITCTALQKINESNLIVHLKGQFSSDYAVKLHFEIAHIIPKQKSCTIYIYILRIVMLFWSRDDCVIFQKKRFMPRFISFIRRQIKCCKNSWRNAIENNKIHSKSVAIERRMIGEKKIDNTLDWHEEWKWS